MQPLFFFPSFGTGTIRSLVSMGDCLFHLTPDYGKMKPCRVQQKDRLVFPYRFLHGFILFQKQKYHIYKDKVLWTRKHTDSCARQELHHSLSGFPTVRCNGCAEQRLMTMLGRQATLRCLATCCKNVTYSRRGQRIPPTAHAFRRSGAVFRRTAFLAMGHGQETHTQPAGRTYGDGACRHLPLKGGFRDDLPVPVRVGNAGWHSHSQPVYP